MNLRCNRSKPKQTKICWMASEARYGQVEGVFGWTRIFEKNTHLLYTPCSSKTTKSAKIYTVHDMGPHGGPQNTVTPIPLSPNPKTSIPNKQTNRRDVSETSGRKNLSRRKQATHHPNVTHPHAGRVTQINFEEFLEGSLRLNGAAKYLGFCRWQVVVVVGGWFFGAFFWGGTRLWPFFVEAKLVDDKRVGLLRHLVCNYLGVEMSALAERILMRPWFSGVATPEGKIGRRFHHDVRSPLLRLRQKWGLRFQGCKISHRVF